MNEFVGTLDQLKMVNVLADQAYQEFARDSNFTSVEKAYSGSYCMEISHLLIEKLLDEGYAPKHRKYGPWHQHVYLGNDWIADPTWQQFPHRLPLAETLGLPRVLIVQIPFLPTTLSCFGVNTDLQKYWLDATIIN